MGSVVVAHRLYSAGSVVVVHGLVALWHVGSSQTRDQTCVPCLGRHILNHYTTREVPSIRFLKCLFFNLSMSSGTINTLYVGPIF